MTLDDSLRIKIAQILSEKILLIGNAGDSRAQQLPIREQSQAIAVVDALALKLQEAQLKFVDGIAELDRRLGETLIMRRIQLDNEFESEMKSLNELHKKRMDELDEKEKEFDEIKRRFDEREPRHVRRELRKNLLEEIKLRSQRFELTEGTRRLRWIIHVAFLFAILAFGTGSFFYGNMLYSAPWQDWSTWIMAAKKSTLMTVAAATALLYYIRWQNKWFEQHARAEFRLKQFQLDVERASWLAETAMEWHHDRKEMLPEPIFRALARNLFVHDDETVESIRHPADELASAIFGAAANTRLKIGDSEVTFDRKSMRELKS